MRNREQGNYRPTFFCFNDPQITGLIWVVPMSANYEKYKLIKEKDELRHGRSLKIVLGNLDGKNCAFLIQNMFPITSEFISHIHTKQGNPVPVTPLLASTVKQTTKTVIEMTRSGIRIVYPDILRLERMMINQIEHQNYHHLGFEIE